MERARVLKEQDEIGAIGDPFRLAILRRLMARPATISQLGTALGKHPAAIRHHLGPLVRAGLVELCEVRKVRNYVEKYYRASAPAYSLQLMLVGDYGGRPPLVAVGSHDLAFELLLAPEAVGPDGAASDACALDQSGGGPQMLPLAVGSLDGLVMLRQGLADMAGCHLLDPESGEYNVPYVKHMLPDRPVVVVTLAGRQQGLITKPGNPRKITSVEDFARPDVGIVNRNVGSGTRLWLDRQLRKLGIPHEEITGYETVVSTHTETAAEVAAGRADAGIGIQAAAERLGLGFVPLFQERYDLVIPRERYQDVDFHPLLDRLEAASFKKAVRALGGYDTHETGHEEALVV
ncbi:MAG: ArsR family transcriptional regulator [Actinobacteria bacterium]|nr:MAG: ArsR family transcriptional regulator [Actinomycetota bacterium]